MGITVVNYGDQISPGSQPVLVFPIISNQLIGAITLAGSTISSGTYVGTDVETGSVAIVDGQGGPFNATSTETGTINESGTLTASGDPSNITANKGLVGYQSNVPIAGQLGNLNVFVSKDGGPFVAGAGTLAEIANGYYRYIPAPTETNNPPTTNSSNTGLLTVRVRPANPLIIPYMYVEETMLTLRLRAPGVPPATLSPSSQSSFTQMMQPTTDDLKKFIRSAIRDLLGNQMTTKPTFRKE